MLNDTNKVCLCGCGLPVKPGRKYAIGGHARRGRPTPPELKAASSARQKLRWQDPKEREKQSEKAKTRYQDPVFRAKMESIENNP